MQIIYNMFIVSACTVHGSQTWRRAEGGAGALGLERALQQRQSQGPGSTERLSWHRHGHGRRHGGRDDMMHESDAGEVVVNNSKEMDG